MLDSPAMARNLVIVESPAKAKTIERYLGPDYTVLASYGHVRDLPENPGKGKFGVDVEHDFAPQYVVPDDRRKQVDQIAKAARRADAIYLATDLDREGEAIAWHVAEATEMDPKRTQRVTFNEITRGAVLEAFAHPRQIDTNLVDAQQTRRIVDRLVGYTLSPLLSRKVRGGLSAGRVQSVAVRIVVDREREIGRFLAREYWTIEVALRTAGGVAFIADLVRIDGAAAEIAEGESAETHAAALRTARPVVDKTGTAAGHPQPGGPVHDEHAPAGGEPQARLQPEADDVGRPAAVRGRRDGRRPGRAHHLHAHRLDGDRRRRDGRGARRHRRALRPALHDAQGPRLPDQVEGRPGGPRGDPADELRARSGVARRAYLKSDEAAPLPAHLAARPRLADGRQGDGDDDVELTAGRYGLRATATRTVFDGFSRVYTEGRDDEAEEGEEERTAPVLAAGDVTTVDEVRPTQHFTEPPPRYTEATLIKALEEHGIGRPSTYAATISTITDRGYVTVVEKRLRPEIVAEIVTDLLVEHFGEFVDLEFTARMEERLDEVASGERAWVPLLREFYDPLKELVDEKRRELKRKDFTTEATDELCSLGHPMVIRLGRNGRFLACSLYPEHKEIAATPRRGAAGHRRDRRSVPRVQHDGRRRPRHPARSLRSVRGLLALPGLHVHPEDRATAARPAAVHRHVPAVRGGPPGDPPRPPHGQPVLGLLALPDLRLHDVARAGGGRPRRGRWADRQGQ